MTKSLKLCASIAILSSLLLGCGPGSVAVEQVAVPTKDILKVSLQGPADSGQLGSEMITIEESIEKMKSEDPAKGEALAKDYEALKAAKAPAAVKAKAKEMIGKL